MELLALILWIILGAGYVGIRCLREEPKGCITLATTFLIVGCPYFVAQIIFASGSTSAHRTIGLSVLLIGYGGLGVKFLIDNHKHKIQNQSGYEEFRQWSVVEELYRALAKNGTPLPPNLILLSKITRHKSFNEDTIYPCENHYQTLCRELALSLLEKDIDELFQYLGVPISAVPLPINIPQKDIQTILKLLSTEIILNTWGLTFIKPHEWYYPMCWVEINEYKTAFRNAVHHYRRRHYNDKFICNEIDKVSAILEASDYHLEKSVIRKLVIDPLSVRNWDFEYKVDEVSEVQRHSAESYYDWLCRSETEKLMLTSDEELGYKLGTSLRNIPFATKIKFPIFCYLRKVLVVEKILSRHSLQLVGWWQTATKALLRKDKDYRRVFDSAVNQYTNNNTAHQ